jgi:hypothetical protein
MLMNQAWITQTNMIMRVNQLRQRFHALKSGRRKGRVNMIAEIIVQPKIARLLTD